MVFLLSYNFAVMARGGDSQLIGAAMNKASTSPSRLLAERPVAGDAAAPANKRPARSVTVNLTESPLGWLLARGHISRRQFDAGEQLRTDWERAQLAPRVTMGWDAAPVARSRGGAVRQPDMSGAQLD